MKKFNRNPALTTSFKLEFPKFPEINYFIQNTDLPGITMAGVDTPFRNNATSVPSNRIEYDPVTFQVLMDEDYVNYETIHVWMHRVIKTEPVVRELQDSTLHILNSNKNSILGIRYYGMYPTSISSLPLQSDATDETPIVCSMTFRYQFFDFVRNET